MTQDRAEIVALALDVAQTYLDLAQMWLTLDPVRSCQCARNAEYWNAAARRHMGSDMVH